MSLKLKTAIICLTSLVLLLLMREYATPNLLLRLDNLASTDADAQEIPIREDLSVGVYSKTQPFIGKMAPVQKGLVLIQGGEPLVGEGYGLGVPILVVDGVTWLASRSRVSTRSAGDTTIITKTYYLDTIERNVSFPRRKFIHKDDVAAIPVTYRVVGRQIHIDVDLHDAARLRPQRILVMNEQSGRDFWYAHHKKGIRIDLISWQPPVLASDVSLVAPKRDIAFRVRERARYKKHLGREILRRLNWYGLEETNWAGIDIEVPADTRQLSYQILLEHAPPEN